MIILQEGLKNKNSKTRSESLEACYWLLERNGVNSLFSNPSKIISILASCLTDASTRSNCLRIFAFIHGNSTEGASMIQKYAFPSLGAKEKDFLEERLKRCAAPIASIAVTNEKKDFEASESQSKVISQPKRPSGIPTCFKFDFDKVEVEHFAKSNSQSSVANMNTQITAKSTPNIKNPHLLSTQNLPIEQSNFDFIIANLTSEDQVRCLDAINVLYSCVVLGKSESFSTAWKSHLLPIISTLTVSLKLIMNLNIFASPSSLPIKVQVLRKIGEIIERCFQPHCNFTADSHSIIYELLGELLLRLLMVLLRYLEPNLRKCIAHFNSTILCILEHGPKTSILITCIQLLRESCLELSPTSCSSGANPNAEMAAKVKNLILRCLWKTTENHFHSRSISN